MQVPLSQFRVIHIIHTLNYIRLYHVFKDKVNEWSQIQNELISYNFKVDLYLLHLCTKTLHVAWGIQNIRGAIDKQNKQRLCTN